MADRKPDEDKPRLKQPVGKLLLPTDILSVSGETLEFRKLNEIGELLWLPDGLEKEEKKARILRALELYESIGPKDGLEGMLGAQMVGTHFAALECLRRAAISGQTFEARDMALRNAQKLMSLYAQQLAALNKHRGKGRQNITVKHDNVESGGQAIVGNVETRARDKKRPGRPCHA